MFHSVNNSRRTSGSPLALTTLSTLRDGGQDSSRGKKTATATPPHATLKTSSFPGPGRGEQHHGGGICLYLFLK